MRITLRNLTFVCSLFQAENYSVVLNELKKYYLYSLKDKIYIYLEILFIS